MSTNDITTARDYEYARYSTGYFQDDVTKRSDESVITDLDFDTADDEFVDYSDRRSTVEDEIGTSDRNADDYASNVKDSSTYTLEDGTSYRVVNTYNVVTDKTTTKVYPVRPRAMAVGYDDVATGIRVLSHKGGVTYVGKRVGANTIRIQVWSERYAARATCRDCKASFTEPELRRPGNVEGPEQWDRAIVPMRRLTAAVYAHFASAH